MDSKTVADHNTKCRDCDDIANHRRSRQNDSGLPRGGGRCRVQRLDRPKRPDSGRDRGRERYGPDRFRRQHARLADHLRGHDRRQRARVGRDGRVCGDIRQRHRLSDDRRHWRQRHGIDERNTKTLIGHPEPDAANPKQSWYDELVRIPDFIAGSLAAWDYRSNLVPGRPKYAEILQGIVADNRYVTNLLLVDTDEGIGIGRLSCSIRPPADVE